MNEEPRKTDERVRIRAYHLWERDGRPHGRNDEYWAKALEEIRAEDRENTGEREDTGEEVRRTG